MNVFSDIRARNMNLEIAEEVEIGAGEGEGWQEQCTK